MKTKKEEMKNNSLKKKLMRKLSGPKMTGSQAKHISIYHSTDSFENILEEKIKEIDSDIRKNVNYDSKIKFVNYLVIPEQAELYEAVKEEYSQRGFTTYYVGSDRVSELGKDTLLFISWNEIKEEETEEC